jgi:hypothetical protein
VTGVVRYRLGLAEATRRARWAAALRAASALAPVALALVLLHRLGFAPSTVFWVVTAILVVLVGTRAGVGYAGARRRLGSLVVTVSDDDIHVENARAGYSIPRSRVARIVEVEGALGGLRVESLPDAQREVLEAQVPRGGHGYADVRGKLESWRGIERRGRRGPAVRLAVGAAVVVAIFFVPFLLEDFVARSKLVAAALVGGMWLVARVVTRRA